VRRRSDDDEKVIVPFPTSPVSNLEWLPPEPTAKQRLAEKLIAEETAKRAKRHGMTRAQFLRTAAATATAFMVLNKIHGLDQTGDAAAMPIGQQHCDDLDAARELLDWDIFIMDVQQHHVDPMFTDTTFCFLDFSDGARRLGNHLSGLPCPENIGQTSFIREVFINSQTHVGVLSGLPYGLPLGPEGMAKTRDLVNELAGSQRALSQAIVDPTLPPGGPTSIETLEHQVRDLKASALKCYTYSGPNGWRLDDEKVAYPVLSEASRLGLRLVNVHKGLPAIFAPGSPETVRTTDFPKVVRDFPHLRFCAYHSGYFQGNTHPEGLRGITEFIQVIESMPPPDRRRVYAEIGSTFPIVLLQGADQAAHFIGQLLKTLGSRNIIWGTDSIWWGSPQFLIDAFKGLVIPTSMQEQFGYPPLTIKAKRRILGGNAALLYGLKPHALNLCTIPPDRLTQAQAEQGGFRAGRSLVAYGPRTRRQFFAMRRQEERFNQG